MAESRLATSVVCMGIPIKAFETSVFPARKIAAKIQASCRHEERRGRGWPQELPRPHSPIITSAPQKARLWGNIGIESEKWPAGHPGSRLCRLPRPGRVASPRLAPAPLAPSGIFPPRAFAGAGLAEADGRPHSPGAEEPLQFGMELVRPANRVPIGLQKHAAAVG